MANPLSSKPQSAAVVGGIFSLVAPAPVDGQGCAFQVDSAGNLLVNVAVGGGGGGGGTQYVDGVTQATPTGTVALAKNSSNILHSLSLDGSGNLNVNLAAGTITGGNAAASATGATIPASADYTGFNSGGNLVGVSTANPLPVSQQGSVAVTGTFFQATQPVSIAAHVISDQGTAGATAWKVDGSAVTQPVSGTFFQSTQPVSIAAHVIVDQGAAGATAWKVDGSAVTQPVSGSVSVSNFPSTVDVTDRAARLLGVVYGSQAQQLKQTATNFNLQVESAVGGSLIDPRAIRALTSADVVTVANFANPLPVSQSGLWNVNQAIGVAGFEKITDGTNTAAVKAASTAAAAADPSLVIAISPNSSIPTGSNVIGALTANQSVNLAQVGGAAVTLGSKTSANSIPVVLASDEATLPVSIAATVNVSVQNATLAVTQNTTPWVSDVSKFGGNNVVTGTGVGGVGIPRVTVSSDSFPASQTIAGSVSVSNFPATQAVSAASLPLPTGAATDANLISGNDTQSQIMLILESTRRAIVALACEGGRNNPRDFDPSAIALEEGADDYAD